LASSAKLRRDGVAPVLEFSPLALDCIERCSSSAMEASQPNPDSHARVVCEKRAIGVIL